MWGYDTLVGEWEAGVPEEEEKGGFCVGGAPRRQPIPKAPHQATCGQTHPSSAAFWAAKPQVAGLAWVSTSWIFASFPTCSCCLHPPPPQRSQRPPLGAGSLCSESETPAAQTGTSLPGDLPALEF